MNKKTSNSNSNEPRYEGTDWDPVANVRLRGRRDATPKRKVKTRGVITFACMGMMASVAKKLRQGYEVRLLAGMDDDTAAIRLFPCLDKECKQMFVAAQSMGAFRTVTLADKHAEVRIRGEVATETEVERFKDEHKARSEQYKASMLCVTPDTTVTCPNCNTTFRVGKQLADRK